MTGTPPRHSATDARRGFATGSAVRRRRFRLVALIASTILAVPVVATTGAGAAGGRGGGQPPGAPTQVTAQAGNGQATVSFTAPDDKGSSRITSYTVYATAPGTNNSAQASGKKSPITVTGLSNEDFWQIRVAATNRAGHGPAAPAENVVWPTVDEQLAPDPPTNVTAVAGDRQATVTYEAPVRGVINYGVMGYVATAINLTNPGDGGQIGYSGTFGEIPSPVTPIRIGDLTNGDTYAFSVVTTNGSTNLNVPPSSGASAPSELSNSVVPARPPDAPTIRKATAGDEEATVTFTPGSDGGLPIIDYTVTAADETDPRLGGQTASGQDSPIVVGQLLNGHTYTFTVVARNELGVSPPSDPSNPVTLPLGPGQPPGAPTEVTAQAGNAQATVSFTAPDDEGSDPVESYTVYATGPQFNRSAEASGEKSPITVTGLDNEEFWQIRVAANNSAGQGPAAAAENVVWPTADEQLAPDPPTNVKAVPGDGQATVTYEAPVRGVVNYGVMGYIATAINLTHPGNGGQIGFSGTFGEIPSPVTPITINDLPNGDLYAFSVVTTNGTTNLNVPFTFGASAPSELSNVVQPLGLPGAPMIGDATAGNEEATVTFDPPGSNGGEPIIDYTVTAEDETDPSGGGQTASGPDSPIVVGSLTNGHTYTFTVISRTAVGVSPPSAPTNTVVPNGPPESDPGAPTDVRADAGDGEATVSWEPPEKTGGTPILGYTVTAIDRTEPGRGGQSVATSTTSATVKNLTNGDRYVFRVTATNAVGTGPPSDPSDPVVPEGPDGQEAPEREEEPRDEEPEPNREEEPETTTGLRGGSRLTRISLRAF